ncbi:hypothetical protein KR018_009111 [Drosophila ironensis]|nr:hypothetical protein KR018_009111 [Drosophila ironensis]
MQPSTKDGITIRTMTEDDLEAVSVLVDTGFYAEEPLLMSGKVTLLPETLAFSKKSHQKLITHGTSLVALDENNAGRLVGFVLAEPKTPEDFQTPQEVLDKVQPDVRPILSFGNEVKQKANFFGAYGVDKLLYSHITFVVPDMRGKGIGSRLATTLTDVGRANELPLMVAMCTSYYSAKQKEALGMECIFAQSYADYKDSEGKVVFTPPAPHTQARLLAIRL